MRPVIKTLAVAIVLGIGILLAALWVERRTDTSLPPPTGPFAVGRTTAVWSDSTPDKRAPTPGATREVFVWIWYPADPQSPAPIDDYVPDQARPAASPGGFNPFVLLTKDPARVHGHSRRDPGLSPRQKSYPAVLLRGGASTGVTTYSTLAEDLASHGYIVAGIDVPYRTGLVVFPDGRVARRTPENNPELCADRPASEQQGCIQPLLADWVANMRFAVDRLGQLNASDPSGRFTGRIDVTRIGAFGHSLGGAEAAQFCHDDPRCRAAVDIDGRPFGTIIQEGMRRPFMFVLSGDIRGTDPETNQIKADVQSIYDHLPPDSRVMVAISGAFHFTFSDDGAVAKSAVLRGALRLFGKLGIDARRQLEITAYCVHTFFDAHLKGENPAGVRRSLARYPEIELLD